MESSNMKQKLKSQISDILDMYADLYWSNIHNGETIDGIVVFDGIHGDEYYIMQDLLINNKRYGDKKGWKAEHCIYLIEGQLKNSHSPFSYPTLQKQFAKYREIKPSGWYIPYNHPHSCLSSQQIQDILNVTLTDDERRNIENKYLRD